MLISREQNAIVAHVGGNLTVANRTELQTLVLEAVGLGARHVVVDLAQTTYVDSAGLGALAVLAKRVRAQGGELRLANANADVSEVLALTKLDSLLSAA